MKKKYIFLCLLSLGLLSSCKKYLDEVPSVKLAIPNKIEDLRALLDSYGTMSSRFPTATVMLSDDYYLLQSDLNSVTNPTFRNQYTWQYDDSNTGDYLGIYTGPIKSVNVILDATKTVSGSGVDKAAIEEIYASALFYRSFYYYAAAQLFAQPYHQASAQSDLGLPLRLNSDFNEVSVRSSVAQTYDQILKDLLESAPLLPVKQILKTRPTRPAAYGQLARTYMAMADYANAAKFADLCITSYGADSLLDYNSLNAIAIAPFKRFNKEVIFHALGSANNLLANSRAKIDSNLFKSFDDNDLRKGLFFKSNGNGTYQFKGDYNGSGTSTGYAFGGIVLDEIYLIRAEAYARLNRIPEAIKDINNLLITRYKAGGFTPFATTDQKSAITYILNERRKELIFRGTRWTDLRRLKDDPDYSVTPQRNIGGQIIKLDPKSTHYTLLLPASVINITGMQQNPR